MHDSMVPGTFENPQAGFGWPGLDLWSSELKQLVFDLNVTGDGAVRISHEIYDGNRTDVRSTETIRTGSR